MTLNETRRPENERFEMQAEYKRIIDSTNQRFGINVGQIDQLTLVGIRNPRVITSEAPISSITFASVYGFVRLDEWSTDDVRLGEVTLYSGGSDGKTRGMGIKLLREAEKCFQFLANRKNQRVFAIYNPNQYSVGLIDKLSLDTKKFTGDELRIAIIDTVNVNLAKSIEHVRIDAAYYYSNLSLNTLQKGLSINSVGVIYDPNSQLVSVNSIDSSILEL